EAETGGASHADSVGGDAACPGDADLLRHLQPRQLVGVGRLRGDLCDDDRDDDRRQYTPLNPRPGRDRSSTLLRGVKGERDQSWRRLFSVSSEELYAATHIRRVRANGGILSVQG